MPRRGSFDLEATASGAITDTFGYLKDRYGDVPGVNRSGSVPTVENDSSQSVATEGADSESVPIRADEGERGSATESNKRSQSIAAVEANSGSVPKTNSMPVSLSVPEANSGSAPTLRMG